jgi:hypothetical protein
MIIVKLQVSTTNKMSNVQQQSVDGKLGQKKITKWTTTTTTRMLQRFHHLWRFLPLIIFLCNNIY